MKTTMKFFMCGLMIFTLVLSSCSKDGEVGPIGPAGIDGTNGSDGADGADGNANVRTYIFNDVEFGNRESILLDMTDVLTREIIKRDVILVYLRVGNESSASRGRVYQLPSRVNGSFPDNIPTQYIDFRLDDKENGLTERINVRTRSIEDTTLFPDERTPVEWIKVVIIESTFSDDLVNKGNSSAKKILDELEAAGVDTNDYYAVCKYFNISE